tara:strand:- start:261 stop:482 length:222 start_codon:yes stop_codon:yes gene_type:complete
MATFVVASLAGGDFIFDPTWATFNARHEMFRCRYDEVVVEGATTPHTVVAISFQNHRHPFASVRLPTSMVICR